MPLLHHSRHMHVALNTGELRNTHNHACSRTVHILHTRVVTFGGKYIGILMLNKWTSTLVLGAALFWFSSTFIACFLSVQWV